MVILYVHGLFCFSALLRALILGLLLGSLGCGWRSWLAVVGRFWACCFVTRSDVGAGAPAFGVERETRRCIAMCIFIGFLNTTGNGFSCKCLSLHGQSGDPTLVD